MDMRRDPMAGAAEMISGMINTALRMGRPAVTTVGSISADPNLVPAVPERVSFSLDARHPDPEQRALLYARHEALMQAVASRRDLDLEWQVIWDHAPQPCDPALVALLEEAAREQGIPHMLIPSGAGHDAQQMTRVARSAMIFVRSKDGRSHTPAEFTSAEDAAAGIEVLLDDREARPGVMFADMELIGLPHRIVVGEKGLAAGSVEYKGRRDAEAVPVPLAGLLDFLRAKLAAD